MDVDESDKEEDTEEVEETEAFSHLDSLRATSTYSPWTDKARDQILSSCQIFI